MSEAIELSRVTFRGPVVTDPDLLPLLPPELRQLLEQINGFVQFNGGLHVRGACHDPDWHSLRRAWIGDCAFRLHYPALNVDDVPFAQDCVGDQFLLRSGKVVRLRTEFGELSDLGLGLYDFLAHAQADPIGFLGLQPLVRFHREGGTLLPGQLLSVSPPFCCAQSGEQVSLKAVPVSDRLAFLADFSRQIADVPNGSSIRFKMRP